MDMQRLMAQAQQMHPGKQQPPSQRQCSRPQAEEAEAAKGAITKLGGEYLESRAFLLPDNSARSLIFCKKISQTPSVYPRNGGKIAKAPLK